MKNARIIFFAAIILFLCACPAIGTIYFNDGLTHDINYVINDHVLVDYYTPGMYTTVNWLDGADSTYSLQGYHNSRINFFGGSVEYLESYDFSQVNISGGQILYDLYCLGSSQVTMSGGSILYGVFSGDFSQLDISGGSINDMLWSTDSSCVDISGGKIYELLSHYSSQVNISGGSISTELSLYDESMVQIFGSDFTVDDQPVGYGELTSIYGGWPWDEPIRHLTGTLLSGEFIGNDFRIGNDAKIILIPEPATVLLLGIGGLMLRKKRR